MQKQSVDWQVLFLFLWLGSCSSCSQEFCQTVTFRHQASLQTTSAACCLRAPDLSTIIHGFGTIQRAKLSRDTNIVSNKSSHSTECVLWHHQLQCPTYHHFHFSSHLLSYLFTFHLPFLSLSLLNFKWAG